jgi:hypothetical protein
MFIRDSIRAPCGNVPFRGSSNDDSSSRKRAISSLGVHRPFRARDGHRCRKRPRCLHLIKRSSSSLAFAASLMTFARCRVGLQGFPSLDPSASFVRTTGSVPHGLGATFIAPVFVLDRPSPIRLSWDSFSLCAPLLTYLRSFAPRRRCRRRSSQPLPSKPSPLRPCGFSPLRRFTPCESLGFIAPRSQTRFDAFCAARPTGGLPKPTTMW